MGEKKGFGKISSTATRWRPDPLHHSLANSPAFWMEESVFHSPVYLKVKFNVENRQNIKDDEQK